MTEEYANNRKILYIIILFLVVIAGVGVKFFFAQKRENAAVRVKLLSLNELKRTPLPWSYLTVESMQELNKKKAEAPKTIAPTTEANQKSAENAAEEIPISEQTTDQLASTLTINMQNLRELDLEGLDQNIEIAEEIISREPNTYSAYKAKLISLLVKETKFDQNIDEYEVNKVLDNMASFEVANDSTARREAALIAITNNQMSSMENRIGDIALLRDEITTQSSALERTSPEYFELQRQNELLAQQEQMALEELENFENNIITGGALSPEYLNEDIVEIPFLRLMSKNNYEAVMENAASFIEQFPYSPTGYYYLIKALGLQGRADDGIRVIEESNLSPEAQEALLNRLDATSGDDPKKYWEKLVF